MEGTSFRVLGRYFESCNCDAVCPCRMVGGVKGGRSTHGICYGALSWRIDDGAIDDVDVSGLAVALVMSYSDDEPGSPWTLVLHVDANGSDEQRTALEDLFLGRLHGPHVDVLPWIRKERDVVGVRSSAIELVPDGAGHRLRVGDAVAVRATTPAPAQGEVSCIVSGYERIGTELVAEAFAVDDEPFAWELSDTCAFASDFEYASS
jgi:hypothetical protein